MSSSQNIQSNAYKMRSLWVIRHFFLIFFLALFLSAALTCGSSVDLDLMNIKVNMKIYGLFFLILFSPFGFSKERVLVFAASSMASALDEITKEYKKETGKKVTVSYGASSALSRQLVQGSPADIFISANQGWMDYAIDNKVINEKTHTPWLKNTLVLISGESSLKTTSLKTININEKEIAAALGDSRMAIAHPQHVPAGIYAKSALNYFQLWSVFENKMAFSNTVRGALVLVERQEAPLGIVYYSDAKASSKVNIVARFPSVAHEEIIYPIAMKIGRAHV